MIGRTVGSYRIVEKLGEGAMGTVYRAVDQMVDRTVAIKVLKTEIAQNAETLERFHREAVALARLNHPCIAQLYAFFQEGGEYFMVMEFVPGETLGERIGHDGRLPWLDALKILAPVLEGVGHAHSLGILHRDLKPANIMIDGRGQARITDLGLARLATGAGAGEVVGTPAYMAPEQLARGETTVQSDLYSLGLVLYELFTGQPVYEAETIPELQRAHQRPPALPATLVPDLHPAVERMILQCLEKDPRQRPRSARAVAASLPGADPLAAALAAGETREPEYPGRVVYKTLRMQDP